MVLVLVGCLTDKMNLSKVCRSCMKEVVSWERDFDLRAVEMFCFCTNIKVTEEDKLPRQFCYDCIINIESAYTFITEAQKVNITLKNIISRVDTSIIVETSHTKHVEENIKLLIPDDNSDVENVQTYIFDYQNEETIEELPPAEEVKETGHQDVAGIYSGVPEKQKVKIENGDSKHVCPVCRKWFTSKTWFSKHMAKEHTFSCPQCPKTFTKRSLLVSHATSHSDERLFACAEPACGKTFKRRKQLLDHGRSHADARPYACDKCSMRFNLKNILKCHIKMHDHDKPYLCYQCGCSFTQAGNLKAHMRRHTGEKPFSCSTCGYSARFASNLRRHQRQHTGQADYVCTTCRKSFYDSGALTRHRRTHTGERPYPCGAAGCARAFADSWKRKAHLMRAHAVKLQDIPPVRKDSAACALPET